MKAELGLLLTETLLRQVHVDDEEHEPAGSFLLPSDKRVHPAFKTVTRKLSQARALQTGATTRPHLWISARTASFQVLRDQSGVPGNVPG